MVQENYMTSFIVTQLAMAAFVLQWAVCPTEPKIFTNWPFTENFANPNLELYVTTWKQLRNNTEQQPKEEQYDAT